MKKSEASATLERFERDYEIVKQRLDDHPNAKAYIIANMDRLNAAIAMLQEDENGEIDEEQYEALIGRAEMEADFADLDGRAPKLY